MLRKREHPRNVWFFSYLFNALFDKLCDILEDNSEFYGNLQDAVENISTHNCTILIGDFNARIGQDSHTTKPRVIGKNTYHDLTNSNGELLSDFCKRHNLHPTQLSSLTKSPKSRTWTWEHPSGQRAQLDHIIINAKWQNSVRNCRAYNTVELDSDHRIMSVTVKISLRIQGANLVKRKRYNWNRLTNDPKLKEEFQLELRNRFEPLMALLPHEDGIQESDLFEEGMEETAGKVIGLVKSKKSPDWVSEKTAKLREERNKTKWEYNNKHTKETKERCRALKSELNKAYEQDEIKHLEGKLEELKSRGRLEGSIGTIREEDPKCRGKGQEIRWYKDRKQYCLNGNNIFLNS